MRWEDVRSSSWAQPRYRSASTLASLGKRPDKDGLFWLPPSAPRPPTNSLTRSFPSRLFATAGRTTRPISSSIECVSCGAIRRQIDLWRLTTRFGQLLQLIDGPATLLQREKRRVITDTCSEPLSAGVARDRLSLDPGRDLCAPGWVPAPASLSMQSITLKREGRTSKPSISCSAQVRSRLFGHASPECQNQPNQPVHSLAAVLPTSRKPIARIAPEHRCGRSRSVILFAHLMTT